MPCSVSQSEIAYYEALEAKEKLKKKLISLIQYVHTCIPETDSGTIEIGVNGLTNQLCNLCTDMSVDNQMKYMYDGRIKKARELADWWEVHQEFDKKG